MWPALAALVLAVLMDVFGFLPKAIGDRIAAVLALFAISAFLSGSKVASTLVGWGNEFAAWLAKFCGQFIGADAASAIGNYGLAVVVLIVTVFWIAAMLPKGSRRYIGEIALREMDSKVIWGGALIIVVGITLIPGDLGQALRGITSLGVEAGGQIAGAVT